VLDTLAGRDLYLHDAHPAPGFHGAAGKLLARSGDAVCRATVDGAIWIGRLRDPHGPHPFKLPATRVLGETAATLPLVPPNQAPRAIRYEEIEGVGYLHFPFHNGAMGTQACRALLEAYRDACKRPTRVIVLMGGTDFWSNGMDLNLIEAAESPADESWRNINALDDLAEAIITTGSHLTVAALQGNAGAGGVFLARAADLVWARSGVILNPHYKDMGNLYGSEYWTYLLPRRVGAERAQRIVEARLPMGCDEALELGLVDQVLEGAFIDEVRQGATRLACDPDLDARLARERRQRARDEAERPLRRYREEELARMKLNFYGFDPSYHVARYNFVHKVPKSRTPPTLALHRRLAWRHRRAG
jgi:putative two-component system hydrogenase maturation factor HypX/HoxX